MSRARNGRHISSLHLHLHHQSFQPAFPCDSIHSVAIAFDSSTNQPHSFGPPTSSHLLSNVLRSRRSDHHDPSAGKASNVVLGPAWRSSKKQPTTLLATSRQPRNTLLAPPPQKDAIRCHTSSNTRTRGTPCTLHVRSLTAARNSRPRSIDPFPPTVRPATCSIHRPRV
jgi:hypothetical protein